MLTEARRRLRVAQVPRDLTAYRRYFATAAAPSPRALSGAGEALAQKIAVAHLDVDQ
jgi:hypothetical protein